MIIYNLFTFAHTLSNSFLLTTLSLFQFNRRGHEGLRMGPRHIPLNAAFMNGTVEGEDVWIPMTSILGGQERCGFGWNMFVECLAEGRGVSLPAGSIGAARSVVAGVGAYSRVRKQFRVPIAEFGGIQEGEFNFFSCRRFDFYVRLDSFSLFNSLAYYFSSQCVCWCSHGKSRK